LTVCNKAVTLERRAIYHIFIITHLIQSNITAMLQVKDFVF